MARHRSGDNVVELTLIHKSNSALFAGVTRYKFDFQHVLPTLSDIPVILSFLTCIFLEYRISHKGNKTSKHEVHYMFILLKLQVNYLLPIIVFATLIGDVLYEYGHKVVE
jgi:hypothetical protein